MSIKILITGSKGFIGSNLVNALSSKYEVHAHDIDTLNLLDPDKTSEYLKSMRFDVIIHTAGWTDKRNSINTSNDVLANNLKMFFNITRNSNYFQKLIYYGSGAEYSRPSHPRIHETYLGTHIPTDAYGLSKYIMSKHISSNIYELILFSIFGPGEDYTIRFISNSICKSIFNMPITIKNDSIYDYVYIDDLVKITEYFINHSPSDHRYNISSPQPTSLYSIAQFIKTITFNPYPIIISQQGTNPEYSGDNSRLLSIIPNFKFTPIETAIKSLYQYYLSNKQNIKQSELLFDQP